MLHKEETREIRAEWVEFIHELQHKICSAIEKTDGKALFSEEAWERADGKGGGGLTKVIQRGDVFEKGGVNTSVVHGQLTESIRSQLNISPQRGAQERSLPTKWFAAGLSLVIHPVNPFVPTVHCNYRMFELSTDQDVLLDRWFGGGTDLTPYYLFEEDASHFHHTYKNVCDEFDPSFYPAFKKHCDDYFVNKHRNNERRGIGGIFYDHQRPNEDHDLDFWMNFGRACGNAFIPAYLPIVDKRKKILYTAKHKYWQEIRRGRYVEFNLIHDRGTLFGLKSGGRTESILMSLPPTVRFDYDFQPDRDSEEEKLTQLLINPKEWV
ncbi:MAG TPA: oxygen-dependent coproporphyrinogen oxidase [Chitinophagaceae bacterium]|nr:oxygen-dependent coproporphyrinogen oxidase [Chitinophagaceae bacterium]